MDSQKNPFKQFLPDEMPPQKQVGEEVMGNIRMKSFLVNMLEFFSAILGITLLESVVPVSDNGKIPGEAGEDRE